IRRSRSAFSSRAARSSRSGSARHPTDEAAVTWRRAAPASTARSMDSAMARRFETPALLLLSMVIVVMYVWRLGSAPIYLAHDEVLFAVQEHTLGTTLHDTNG